MEKDLEEVRKLINSVRAWPEQVKFSVYGEGIYLRLPNLERLIQRLDKEKN